MEGAVVACVGGVLVIPALMVVWNAWKWETHDLDAVGPDERREWEANEEAAEEMSVW